MFLGAAALALLSRRVRRAFADASVERAKPSPERDGSPGADLVAARARAAAAGLPLVVIVIPVDVRDKDTRGHAFGEYLHHATPDELAPLARAEVVCAPLASVAAVAPGLSLDGKGEPLLVRIDADGATRAAYGALPALERGRVVVVGPNAPPPRSDDAVIAERIAVVARAVAEVLPGPAGRPDAADVVKERLVKRPPDGAHWATSSGCGVKVEDTPEEIAEKERRRAEARKRGVFLFDRIVAVGCGMGHTPEKSRRFLHFFARDDDA
jgi:hypothetical protein